MIQYSTPHRSCWMRAARPATVEARLLRGLMAALAAGTVLISSSSAVFGQGGQRSSDGEPPLDQISEDPLLSSPPDLPPPPIRRDPVPPAGPATPCLSPDGSRIIFSQAGKLWVVPAAGGRPQPVSTGPGDDRWPVWSPRGDWVAFASSRAGNYDLFVIRPDGSDLRRLTFDEVDDWPSGFSPDGHSVIFHSRRAQDGQRILAVSVEGGEPRTLVSDRAGDGSMTPDGRFLLFTQGEVPWWRVGYRGSASHDVFRMDLATREVERLTDFPGNDLWPQPGPTQGTVLFVSEERGVRNLWWSDSAGRRVPITSHRNEGISVPRVSADGRRVVYEQSGRLWLLDLVPYGQASRQLDVEIEAELIDRDPVGRDPIGRGEVDPGSADREPLDSPAPRTFTPGVTGGVDDLRVVTGGRLLVVKKGEILLLRSEPGPAASWSAENLTNHPFRDRDPALSPDGRVLLFASDRSGQFDLYKLESSDPEEPRVLEAKDRRLSVYRSDSREKRRPKFSPDGRFVLYAKLRQDRELLVLADPDGGREVVIATGTQFESFEFSPDSRWIAFSRADDHGQFDVFLASLFGGDEYNLSAHPGRDIRPRWSPDGRRLAYLSDRAGSLDVWGLDVRDDAEFPGPDPSRDTRSRRSITSRVDTDTGLDGAAGSGDLDGAGPDGEPFGLPGLDVDDLSTALVRTAQITRLFGDETDLAFADDGEALFVCAEVLGQPDLWSVGWDGGVTRLTDDGRGASAIQIVETERSRISGPSAAAGGHPRHGSLFFLDRDGEMIALDGQRKQRTTVAVETDIPLDEREQLPQMFEEVWRSLDQGFYDPHMHLTHWATVGDRYRERLGALRTRAELTDLLLRMAGELNASHLGERLPTGQFAARTGRLGLSFAGDTEGRRWPPGNHRTDGRASPEAEPGLVVESVAHLSPASREPDGIGPGDRLLRVDRRAVGRSPGAVSLEESLLGRVGIPIEVVWNRRGSSEQRTSTWIPVDTVRENDLWYSEWVSARKELTRVLGSDRVGYVHLRDIERRSLEILERELFLLQRDKEGVVLDLRANVGGSLQAEMLEILTRRPILRRQARREGELPMPGPAWQKPLVVIIGPTTGSAAEIVAHGLQVAGLARLVGLPTYGGVIGTTEIELIDGSRFRVPSVGWYTLDGTNLENRGVVPDLEVVPEFEEAERGEDRQLGEAVREMLRLLRDGH